MKKFILIAVLLILILVCIYSFITFRASKASGLLGNDKASDSSTNSVQIIVNEQSRSKNDTFYLGMSRQETVAKLIEMNIDILNEIEITSNINDWDYGNKVFWTEFLDFSFDKDDSLYRIDINQNMPTTLGLKAGDCFDDMQKIYGESYIFYQTSKINVYEYVADNHYLWFFISKGNNGKISSWAISKYRYDNKFQTL